MRGVRKSAAAGRGGGRTAPAPGPRWRANSSGTVLAAAATWLKRGPPEKFQAAGATRWEQHTTLCCCAISLGDAFPANHNRPKGNALPSSCCASALANATPSLHILPAQRLIRSGHIYDRQRSGPRLLRSVARPTRSQQIWQATSHCSLDPVAQFASFYGSLLGLSYPVQPCGRAVWHAVGEQLQGMPSRHATTATKRSWGGALLLRPVVVASARPHRAQLVVCLSQASPDPAGVVWCCASARPRRTQLVLVCASGTALLF